MLILSALAASFPHISLPCPDCACGMFGCGKDFCSSSLFFLHFIFSLFLSFFSLSSYKDVLGRKKRTWSKGGRRRSKTSPIFCHPRLDSSETLRITGLVIGAGDVELQCQSGDGLLGRTFCYICRLAALVTVVSLFLSSYFCKARRRQVVESMTETSLWRRHRARLVMGLQSLPVKEKCKACSQRGRLTKVQFFTWHKTSQQTWSKIKIYTDVIRPWKNNVKTRLWSRHVNVFL